MQKNVEIVFSKEFINRFKKVLVDFYGYETYLDFIVIPFLWKKTLSYIPLLSYSDRKNDEVKDLLELSKDSDYQIKTLNFDYNDFKNDDTVTMRIDMQDIDELWNSFSSKLRTKIRKIKSKNFTLKIGNSDKFLDDFYILYSQAMLEHGTPVLDKALFFALRDEFLDDIACYNFYDNKKIIGTLFVFFDKEIAMGEWMGIDKNYKRDNLSYLMFFESIKDSFKRENIKVVDLGRSAFNQGTYDFKKKFKAYPVKIDTYKPKDDNIYKKYTLASTIWKKLPKPLADKLGSKLSKYLKDL